jgi:L-alanine-DL-glutamate epimerase-like enolase superfamily enzyme
MEKNSVSQQLGHHLKSKMYGDKALDMELLSTVRQVLGDDSLVISDANRGYKDWKSLEELASTLSDFEQQGLSAIEDPASLTVQQWIGLQNKLDRLSLIPDHPMRPV